MAALPAWLVVRLAFAFAVALALVGAGCAKPSDGAQPGAIQRAVDAVTGADPGASLGAIGGVVQSSSLEPIKDARVTLLRENVSTRADASGLYRFDALAPGSYLLTAEADGFVARSAVGDARNGSLTLINFTLAPAPKMEPFHETLELKGSLSCALAVQTPAGDQRRDCAAADPNHRDNFEFPIGAGARSAVLELSWDVAKQPGAKRLNLHARTLGYGASDMDLGNVTGEGYARVVVPFAVMEKYYASNGGAMRALVQLADDGAPPASAAFQEAFTLYVTTFFVKPGPDAFSVVKTAS